MRVISWCSDSFENRNVSDLSTSLVEYLPLRWSFCTIATPAVGFLDSETISVTKESCRFDILVVGRLFVGCLSHSFVSWI